MMIKRGIRLGGLALTITISALSAAEQLPVLDPLLDLPYGDGELRKVDSTEPFDTWQCKSSLANHDEAIEAGLEAGMVVYGVPLRPGGVWDTRRVSRWKNENCAEAMSARPTFLYSPPCMGGPGIPRPSRPFRAATERLRGTSIPGF